ncbi:hypothetical protein, partial [Desertihabitans aurantiacus]|uniref:hypothetical protein n=1 Tax=Desertihabitans aurantiacus TaxID=2282477 RepID=UPI001300B657
GCAEHPLALEQPALAIEALLLAARAARADGDPAAALDAAERAARTSSSRPVPDLQAEAEAVRIGCLMELGRTEEAVAASDALAAVLDDIPTAHVRGIAQWVVGNVRLLTGATEEAMERHRDARRLINPAVDLGTWGRFRKAAATVRVQLGITEDVDALLEEAGSALRIVGAPSDLTGLRLAEARLRLLRGETARARQLVEFCAGEEEVARSPYSRAELEVLRADLAAAAGDRTEEAAACRRAALGYQEAGLLPRSVQLWMRHSELLTGGSDTDA